MKNYENKGQTMPTAAIAINKSRVKVYNRNLDLPTYYLQKGQEFQLELFNPTNQAILAKIFLNGNAISQGGLVLRPGERVFLDRYLDVPKKFLFDTYEVSNTNEVKKAIENNGDFKVEFYKEYVRPNYNINYIPDIYTYFNQTIGDECCSFGGLGNTSSGTYTTTSFNSTNVSNTASLSNNLNLLYLDMSKSVPEPSRLKSKSIKSVETGRVEKGSESNQKIKTVNMDWEIIPFHTVEYKMLPISQKVMSSDDINVKRYCTNCGSKIGKTHKYCANCGSKG